MRLTVEEAGRKGRRTEGGSCRGGLCIEDSRKCENEASGSDAITLRERRLGRRGGAVRDGINRPGSSSLMYGCRYAGLS